MAVQTWASNLTFQPARELRPGTVQEVVDAVRQAGDANQRVRAIGSAWSFTDIVHTDDLVIRTDRLKAIHAFARGSRVWGPTPEVFRGLRPDVAASDRRFVHFQSGLTVKELYTALDTPDASGRDRWAMLTQGASSRQTVVGAAATGTHGADPFRPPLAGTIRAIHLVGPGGHHHWLERASGVLRITDPWGPLAAIPGLRTENVHYDDERFLAAVVGLGSLGVVVSVIVEARAQYGLSQKLVPIRWSAVKQAYRDGRLFTQDATRRVPDRHPWATSTGIRVNSAPAALEIFLNPFRIDDNYSGIDPGDRNCLVVERREAVALDGRSAVFDAPIRPPELRVDEGQLMLDVELHGADRYRGRVDEVMRAARVETAGYPVAHSVLDTYDGTGKALPALGIEIVVPTTEERWIRFVDWMLFNFDIMVRRGKKLAGFISLRFSQRSEELLGMQNFIGSPRDRVCHIEVFALKEINIAHTVALEVLEAVFSGGWSLAHHSDPDPDIDHSGNFEGASDDFVKYFEDSASALGERMHWGQLHRLDRAEVEDAYRLTLPAWRRIRTELSEGGSAKTFSNGFTERCGLESNQEVLAVTSPAPNRYDLFTYDESGNVLWLSWNGGSTWSNIGNAFPHAQRFVGPLTATSSRPGRIDVFGMGRGGRLLHLYWNGSWNWADITDQVPGGAGFLGPITATSWRDGRIDVFGLGASGNVRQLSFDRRWSSTDHVNQFPAGQRFSGSISATCSGPGRIDILGLGRGQQLLHLSRDGTWQWKVPTPGYPVRQRFTGPPASSSWGPGHLDLVGLGPKNNVLHVWVPTGYAEDLGNGFSGDVTRLIMPDDGSDGYYRFESRRMQPMFVGPIAGASWGAGRIDYFGFDSAGNVRRLWFEAGWHWADLGRGW